MRAAAAAGGWPQSAPVPPVGEAAGQQSAQAAASVAAAHQPDSDAPHHPALRGLLGQDSGGGVGLRGSTDGRLG